MILLGLGTIKNNQFLTTRFYFRQFYLARVAGRAMIFGFTPVRSSCRPKRIIHRPIALHLPKSPRDAGITNLILNHDFNDYHTYIDNVYQLDPVCSPDP
jgi:hypothetical protein